MTTRVTFYNRDGSRATEIECTCTRGWIYGAMGQAKIQVALDDAKLLQSTDFGQFVVIEHPRVGAWGGKVWPQYVENDTDGYAELTAYTGELMFKQRRVINTSYQGTAGQIFTKLIERINQQEDTLIQLGSVDNAGISWTETIEIDSAFDVLVRIAKKSGQVWSIEPAFDVNGRLYFQANWHEQRGTVHPEAVRFEQGTHLEAARGNSIAVQGDLANDVLVYGNAGSQASKIYSAAIDSPARDQWGLNQLTIGVSDADQASLNAAVVGILNQVKQPVFNAKFVLLDVPCGGGSGKAFDFANLGDVATYHRTVGRYAGDWRIRVMAREFDERTGKLELIIARLS